MHSVAFSENVRMSKHSSTRLFYGAIGSAELIRIQPIIANVISIKKITNRDGSGKKKTVVFMFLHVCFMMSDNIMIIGITILIQSPIASAAGWGHIWILYEDPKDYTKPWMVPVPLSTFGTWKWSLNPKCYPRSISKQIRELPNQRKPNKPKSMCVSPCRLLHVFHETVKMIFGLIRTVRYKCSPENKGEWQVRKHISLKNSSPDSKVEFPKQVKT